MSTWLSEISRSLRGEALIRHVENRLYRNCEGQPRRPKRDDPHWTRRARALINQAGLSGRLNEVSAAPAGRRGGQSDNAAHPTQPGWTDDPEFWAPLMGTDEATPGEASEHGATSFLNSCCEC